MRATTLPPDDARQFTGRSVLGEALRRQGKHDEAERLLLAAYAGLANAPPPASADRPRTASRLADLYDAWGKPGEATRWRAAAALAPVPAPAGTRPSPPSTAPAGHAGVSGRRR